MSNKLSQLSTNFLATKLPTVLAQCLIKQKHLDNIGQKKVEQIWHRQIKQIIMAKCTRM